MSASGERKNHMTKKEFDVVDGRKGIGNNDEQSQTMMTTRSRYDDDDDGDDDYFAPSGTLSEFEDEGKLPIMNNSNNDKDVINDNTNDKNGARIEKNNTTNNNRYSKCLFLFFLCLAGTLMTTFVYFATSNDESRDFNIHFQDVAMNIMETSNTKWEGIVSTIESLSTTLTSHMIIEATSKQSEIDIEHDSFPPGFLSSLVLPSENDNNDNNNNDSNNNNRHGPSHRTTFHLLRTTTISTDAVLTVYLPSITSPLQYRQWSNYSSSNQNWITSYNNLLQYGTEEGIIDDDEDEKEQMDPVSEPNTFNNGGSTSSTTSSSSSQEHYHHQQQQQDPIFDSIWTLHGGALSNAMTGTGTSIGNNDNENSDNDGNNNNNNNRSLLSLCEGVYNIFGETPSNNDNDNKNDNNSNRRRPNRIPVSAEIYGQSQYPLSPIWLSYPPPSLDDTYIINYNMLERYNFHQAVSYIQQQVEQEELEERRRRRHNTRRRKQREVAYDEQDVEISSSSSSSSSSFSQKKTTTSTTSLATMFGACNHMNWFNAFLSATLETSIAYPVFDDFQDDVIKSWSSSSSSSSSSSQRNIVGHILSVIPWNVFFRDLLPESTPPVYVVIHSICGKNGHSGNVEAKEDNNSFGQNNVFTLIVDGPTVMLLSPDSDIHESAYDDMKVEYSFPTTNGKEDEQTYSSSSSPPCSFVISIYPTSEMKYVFFSSRPVTYTITILLIFTSMAILFFLYDYCLEK